MSLSGVLTHHISVCEFEREKLTIKKQKNLRWDLNMNMSVYLQLLSRFKKKLAKTELCFLAPSNPQTIDTQCDEILCPETNPVVTLVCQLLKDSPFEAKCTYYNFTSEVSVFVLQVTI